MRSSISKQHSLVGHTTKMIISECRTRLCMAEENIPKKFAKHFSSTFFLVVFMGHRQSCICNMPKLHMCPTLSQKLLREIIIDSPMTNIRGRIYLFLLKHVGNVRRYKVVPAHKDLRSTLIIESAHRMHWEINFIHWWKYHSQWIPVFIFKKNIMIIGRAWDINVLTDNNNQISKMDETDHCS